MTDAEQQPQLLLEEALGLMELTELAFSAKSLDFLAEHMLPGIVKMARSGSAFLYIVDPEIPDPLFFQHGLQTEAESEIKKLCKEQFDRISSCAGMQTVSVSTPPSCGTKSDLMLYPLRADEKCIGIFGLTGHKDTDTPHFLGRLLHLLTVSIGNLLERKKAESKISNLNTYLTVSSMLAQSIDIQEMLEITLTCCMETVSAEAASILLLDDKKENFYFYNAEGPAKPVLLTSTFPANLGIAGSILKTKQSEIINDVLNDPRFYNTVDDESGFQTRNMIAIPLVAGEEWIGVLEVLNKAGGASFSDEEHLLLQMVAEEIAFAIRNARVFDYVVKSYCKQRQGLTSCKGCKRPLGSWTPCVKYRRENEG